MPPLLPKIAPRPPEPDLGCGGRILLALLAIALALLLFWMISPHVVAGDGSKRAER